MHTLFTNGAITLNISTAAPLPAQIGAVSRPALSRSEARPRLRGCDSTSPTLGLDTAFSAAGPAGPAGPGPGWALRPAFPAVNAEQRVVKGSRHGDD
jgi:hypothetical protein